MKIMDKILISIDICNGEFKDNFKYNYIYPFATENINGYIDKLSLDNKSYLTIGSSGDQVLNGIMYGSNDITLIDICPFAKEYLYLKMALIPYLSREEFLKFFCYRSYYLDMFKNYQTLSNGIFHESLDYLEKLDPESSYLWRELYKKFNGLTIRRKLFSHDELPRNVLTMINPYLMSDDNYNLLKDKLSNGVNINYINDDIFKYDFNKSFDNINLSNLGTCYKLDKFLKLINKLGGNLNNDGNMLISYLYDTDEALYGNSREIYNVNSLIPKLPQGSELSSFIGVSGYNIKCNGITDSVITYKKVKK